MNRQSIFVALLSALVLTSAGSAHSAQTANPSTDAANSAPTSIGPTQPSSAPLALHGYDPVSYFMHAEALQGGAEMQAVVDGKTYRFVMVVSATASMEPFRDRRNGASR